jgi:hypothetical protein
VKLIDESEIISSFYHVKDVEQRVGSVPFQAQSDQNDYDQHLVAPSPTALRAFSPTNSLAIDDNLLCQDSVASRTLLAHTPAAPYRIPSPQTAHESLDFGAFTELEHELIRGVENTHQPFVLGRAVEPGARQIRAMTPRQDRPTCFFASPVLHYSDIAYPDREIAGIDISSHASQSAPSVYPGSDSSTHAPHIPSTLSSLDEAKFLRSFSENMGKWIDLSDLKKTFSKQVPHLARQDALVNESIIACAAKHLALVHSSDPLMEIAIKYYDSAISTLINRLSHKGEAMSTNTFAATVICSAYEMLDATGTEWKNHLEGIFQMGRIIGVTGSCGGVEQAGFWCVARQETICSILSRKPLRIDPELWGISLSNVGRAGREDLVNCQ